MSSTGIKRLIAWAVFIGIVLILARLEVLIGTAGQY